MKLGLAVDSEWIRSALFDNEDNLIYCYQHKTLPSPQQTAAVITSNALSMPPIFGPFTQVSLTVMPDCWQSNHQKNTLELARGISTQLAIPCHVFEPAAIALMQTQSLPKGNILSAVLDDGCDLCVSDAQCHHAPQEHILNLSWAHQPLARYDSVIDGITPCCSCGSDECIRQYLSQKGVERQYHQLSLQHRSASDIINDVDDQYTWSSRIYRIWVDQLARALCRPVMCFQPTLLILSGSLILRDDMALTLKSSLSRYCAYQALPEIECLRFDKFRFAQGAVSMHGLKTIKSPTFES